MNRTNSMDAPTQSFTVVVGAMIGAVVLIIIVFLFSISIVLAFVMRRSRLANKAADHNDRRYVLHITSSEFSTVFKMLY